jgi:transcriptional regulator with XRE-family HTH domain
MRILSPRQVKAARALLDWEIADLAQRADLHRDTIASFENGKKQAHADSMQQMATALTKAGVEFLEHDGVRLRPVGNIEILKGATGLREFFTSVADYTDEHGGHIVQFGINEPLFRRTLGAEFSDAYMQRMTAIAKRRKDVIVQAIVATGDDALLADAYNEYRPISDDVFDAVPFYIHGDTLAIMDFQSQPAPTILLLNYPSITQAYRKQFAAFWRLAAPRKTKGGK